MASRDSKKPDLPAKCRFMCAIPHGQRLDGENAQVKSKVASRRKISYKISYMSQITLYIEHDTLEKARIAARARGVSLSRWVTEVLRQQTAREWAPAFKAAAGAWGDDDGRCTEGADLPRRDW
jgi:hypothetical protein